MMRAFSRTCLLAAACVAAMPGLTHAQEMIHAVTGTVAAINSAAKTISVLVDNGPRTDFQLYTNGKARIAFDKRIEADSTAADAFDKQGAYVIVFYYYGKGDSRTVVALKSLGAGPFSSTEGTVTKYDSHAHTLSVQDKSGKVQNFSIDPKTVAESTTGALPGDHFRADKGDQVRIVSSTSGGNPTALFVRDL
ncbi:MAG TPA: hypothetical protein VGL22_04675 [Terracidiphilus sp.]|jgi:hypothetical protein